jgi:site-specific recombinase XerD
MKLSKAIEGYIIDCRTRGRSGRTIELYEQRLRVFVRWVEEEEGVQQLNQIEVTHLRSFVLSMQTETMGRSAANRGDGGKPIKVSPLTVKGYVQVIKSFFSWCYDEELIGKNPSKRLKLPSVPDYMIPTFTPEHIKMMLEACDLGTTLGYRDYTIILVLLETGIRVSELCGMCVQDVYNDHIRVFGKGKKEREVGVSPQVAKQLWKYINHYRKPRNEQDARVFINRYGIPVTPNGVEQLLVDIKNRAGITGVRVSAHTFRHTFARMYLEQGGEIYKLSRLMGHGSVEVTEEYLKDFNVRAARLEQEKFSPVNSLGLAGKRKNGKGRKQTNE